MPAVVAEHALDRQVRLAGVGGPEHGRHVADAGLEVAAHLENGLLIVTCAYGIAETSARDQGSIAASKQLTRIVMQ